jgi:hypothetical protein
MFNTVPYVVAVLYTGGDYGDFRLTVRASEIRHTQGNGDYYGVVFRARHDQSRYYLFEISPDDDKYSFLRYDGTESGTSRHDEQLPPGILKSNASNTLTVDARGNKFTFFVNGVLVAQPISDESASPLLKGRIGLCVGNQGTEVAFSQLFINE